MVCNFNIPDQADLEVSTYVSAQQPYLLMGNRPAALLRYRSFTSSFFYLSTASSNLKEHGFPAHLLPAIT